jgi:hypothetical protein
MSLSLFSSFIRSHGQYRDGRGAVHGLPEQSSLDRARVMNGNVRCLPCFARSAATRRRPLGAIATGWRLDHGPGFTRTTVLASPPWLNRRWRGVIDLDPEIKNGTLQLVYVDHRNRVRLRPHGLEHVDPRARCFRPGPEIFQTVHGSSPRLCSRAATSRIRAPVLAPAQGRTSGMSPNATWAARPIAPASFDRRRRSCSGCGRRAARRQPARTPSAGRRLTLAHQVNEPGKFRVGWAAKPV